MPYDKRKLDQPLRGTRWHFVIKKKKVLLVPFTREEMWNALKSIGDLNALGIDGMPSIPFIRNSGLS